MSNKSEILDRTPPHSLDAERSVLGSVLYDPKKLDAVAAIVRPEDFHGAAHRTIYSRLLEMQPNGGIDETLLVERLKDAGELEVIGGMAYLGEILGSVAVAAHAEHYARIVRDKASLRKVGALALDLLQDVYRGQTTGSELLQRARATFERETDNAARAEFPALSCAELDDAAFELDFRIDHTLVAGQPTILAGGKKSLKTSLLIDLGISLAMGGFFLGKLKVNRACRVGIMSGESGMAVIQETARRICSAAGYRLADIGGLVFSEVLPRFDSPEDMSRLRQFVQGNELEVVCIDPTYLAMPGADAGNLFIQGAMLREVNRVCADTGCQLILVHHTRKTGKIDPWEPPELEDISWSGFQEWTRQWLLLSRRERYEPGTGVHRLWLSCGGSAGHSALWALDVSEGVQPNRFWDVNVAHADEARETSRERREATRDAEQDQRRQRRLTADTQAIVNGMAKYPDGETERTLHGASGLYGQRFRTALAELVQTGDVVACQVVRRCRNTPYEGWKLSDASTT